MSKDPLRLLIVEDSIDDAELIVAELEGGGFDVTWHRVETAASLDEALVEREWDIIISDYSMPTYDGIRAFDLVKARGVDTPFLFVSGALGEERAVEAMRAGARDYLLKGNLKRLNAAVRRELAEAQMRRRARAAEEARARLQQRYETIFQSAGAALMLADLSGLVELIPTPSDPQVEPLRLSDDLCWRAAACARIIDVNAETLSLLRAPDREAVLGPLDELLRPGSLELWREVVRRIAEGHREIQETGWLETVDGHRRQVLASVRLPMGHPDGADVVFSMIDITARHELEEQLRAAQRMESIGRLAGGIAHDFNNLLTIVKSYAEFIEADLPGGARQREDAQIIARAAEKAAALTRQLLAFSRKRVQRLEVFSVARVVAELEPLLHRTLGADIVLKTEVALDVGYVKADATHLEQILMNLIVNARDAMPAGGKITTEVANVDLEDTDASQKRGSIPAGRYVMLSVRDTGLGMDQETMSHIFEPFFTTKSAGEGTGLGLSTVYGLVKQSGGFVWVDSEPGRGTIFEIYLPRVNERPQRPTSSAPPLVKPRGSETILVVEDAADVRRAATRILRRRGFIVLGAEGAEEAIEICASHDGPIHVVLTDIVMPGLSGHQLAKRLLARRPAMRVVYMSGYTEDAVVNQAVLGLGAEFVEKPFSADGLLESIRRALDSPSRD